MLSQTVEYSLRAVVWLASHADCPQTNQQIADATLVPAGYLAKIMQAGRQRLRHQLGWVRLADAD